ncbi:MAG: hypothetical protein ACI94Y_003621, partial [Maribacter sp.]
SFEIWTSLFFSTVAKATLSKNASPYSKTISSKY